MMRRSGARGIGLAVGIAVSVGAFGPVAAQPASGWFVPPPPSKSSVSGTRPNIDTHQVGSEEDITVTAKKKPIQRDPRGAEVQEYEARRNVEAGSPEQGGAGHGACEGSAYQTIGGQAATGADIISSGGGRC